MTDAELIQLRNKQVSSNASNWPGYQQAQAQGGFQPKNDLNVSALVDLAKKLVSKVSGAFAPPQVTQPVSRPATGGGVIIGDPSQMKLTSGFTGATPAPASVTSPTQSGQPDINAIRQAIIQTWGKDTPVLDYLPELLAASQKLPDPMLPIAIALRETQGGKDLVNPNKNSQLGKNNPFNIRGIQNGQSKFVDYPNIQTAINGGQNGPDTSQGFAGLVGQNPLYADYRANPDMAKFFAHYSPPADSNGQLTDQVQNYNQIRQKLLGGGR